VLNHADIQPDRVRPLLRAEYEQLVDSGAFENEKIELLDGALVTMSPEGPPHAHTIQQLSEVLMVALRGRVVIRFQSPLALLEDSEPEPDVAVVPLGDYSKRHPSQAHLVVEVAGSSQRRDRLVKGPIYARAGVAEYWIVDLASRTIEVHQSPHGAHYTRVSRHAEGETLRLLAFPDVEVHIGSILPTG
jgi:Uma2 family endonuclease